MRIKAVFHSRHALKSTAVSESSNSSSEIENEKCYFLGDSMRHRLFLTGILLFIAGAALLGYAPQVVYGSWESYLGLQANPGMGSIYWVGSSPPQRWRITGVGPCTIEITSDGGSFIHRILDTGSWSYEFDFIGGSDTSLLIRNNHVSVQTYGIEVAPILSTPFPFFGFSLVAIGSLFGLLAFERFRALIPAAHDVSASSVPTIPTRHDVSPSEPPVTTVPISQLSRNHQEILEAIRTENSDAKISIIALAAFKRISPSRTSEIVQDLINLHLVNGTLHKNTLRLHEMRITCQLCDGEYANPTRYYQCDLCYRSLCSTCAPQLQVISCTIHPQSSSRMVRMPLRCPYCHAIHYDLKLIHKNQKRCPNCDIQFFFH
jgi:hypothetical protein